jgi:hypothetical protein
MKLESLAERTHSDVCAGILHNADEVLSKLREEGSAGARAWEAAIVAARRLVDSDAGEVPSLAGLKGPAVLMAIAHREREALIGWDRDALEALGEARAAIGGTDRGARRAAVWVRIMKGETEGVVEEGKALHAAGSQAQDASMVIDAQLLRAMAALTDDDLEEATSLARRASRMARTEGLRAERFLASILLARVRRRAGRPHLATRILSALTPIAPAPWQGWLVWERVLAGSRTFLESDTDPLQTATDTAASRASSALIRWLRMARAGDVAAFDEAKGEAAGHTEAYLDIDRERNALAAALDPRLDPKDLPERLRPWAIGDEEDTPAGLHGIVGPPDGPADSTIASVVARPDRPPRRLLRVSVPLLQEEGEPMRLERTRLRRGRVDTAVAALALAGPEGLPDSGLFEKAYEFEFVSSLHAGILDVLVHRMRARLEGAATVHRNSGRLRLEPHGILVLPDPRCVEHVEDRLLRVIARHGGVTTRQAAQELDVSVRTAQLALRRLLESGDCVLNRDGRRVEYLVEDTTFTEPTRY